MTTGQILIVDDDAAFVELYRELLEAEGHRVVVANTSEAGTQVLETRGTEIDVVLIDQKLQGAGGPDSGLELLARVRQLTPFAKAIIVTGYSSPEAFELAASSAIPAPGATMRFFRPRALARAASSAGDEAEATEAM